MDMRPVGAASLEADQRLAPTRISSATSRGTASEHYGIGDGVCYGTSQIPIDFGLMVIADLSSNASPETCGAESSLTHRPSDNMNTNSFRDFTVRYKR